MSYEIFAKLCENAHVRPSAVSKATGIAPATLTAWKKGEYTPKNNKLQLIADYFGVTLEYLTTGRSEYYINPDTAEKAQELFENPEMRLLFDAARNSRPEDLQLAADLLRRLKDTNPNG